MAATEVKPQRQVCFKEYDDCELQKLIRAAQTEEADRCQNQFGSTYVETLGQSLFHEMEAISNTDSRFVWKEGGVTPWSGPKHAVRGEILSTNQPFITVRMQVQSTVDTVTKTTIVALTILIDSPHYPDRRNWTVHSIFDMKHEPFVLTEDFSPGKCLFERHITLLKELLTNNSVALSAGKTAHVLSLL